MSGEQLAAVHRQCLLDNIRAHRRACREAHSMPEVWADLELSFREEMLIVTEYLRNFEDRTGYSILSTTRAQMRREGRHV